MTQKPIYTAQELKGLLPVAFVDKVQEFTEAQSTFDRGAKKLNFSMEEGGLEKWFKFVYWAPILAYQAKNLDTLEKDLKTRFDCEAGKSHIPNTYCEYSCTPSDDKEADVDFLITVRLGSYRLDDDGKKRDVKIAHNRCELNLALHYGDVMDASLNIFDKLKMKATEDQIPYGFRTYGGYILRVAQETAEGRFYDLHEESDIDWKFFDDKAQHQRFVPTLSSFQRGTPNGPSGMGN